MLCSYNQKQIQKRWKNTGNKLKRNMMFCMIPPPRFMFVKQHLELKTNAWIVHQWLKSKEGESATDLDSNDSTKDARVEIKSIVWKPIMYFDGSAIRIRV